jgi:hypothetical protein
VLLPRDEGDELRRDRGRGERREGALAVEVRDGLVGDDRDAPARESRGDARAKRLEGAGDDLDRGAFERERQ